MTLHRPLQVARWLLCGVLPLWAGSAVAQGEDKSLYRWTDANGQIHFSDSVPPAAAQTERDQLRSNGNVKKVLPAPKSGEEMAREQAAAEAKSRQDAKDRALLATYSSAAEIEAARDATEQDLERQIAETQRALGQATDTLDRLHQRKASETETTEPAQKARLNEQIANFERLVPADEKILNDLTLKKQKLADGFSSDLARFLKLKSGELPAPK